MQIKSKQKEIPQIVMRKSQSKCSTPGSSIKEDQVLEIPSKDTK